MLRPEEKKSVETSDCPKCLAEPGKPCTVLTSSGVWTLEYPHDARVGENR